MHFLYRGLCSLLYVGIDVDGCLQVVDNGLCCSSLYRG